MIAAILAKRSERFPGKHMKLIGGDTMIGIIARKLSSIGVFSEVIVFTKDSSVKTGLARVVFDNTEGTALDSIIRLIGEYEEVFVVAGDMPMISGDFITAIASAYHGIPVFPVGEGGEIEPLLGIYNTSMLDTLRSCAESDQRKLRAAIGKCRHETVQIGKYKESLLNINRESDLEKLSRQE